MFGLTPPGQHAALPMNGGIGPMSQIGGGGGYARYDQPAAQATPYGGIGFGLGQSGMGGGTSMSMMGMTAGQMSHMGQMGAMAGMGGMSQMGGMGHMGGTGGMGGMHAMPGGGMGGMNMASAGAGMGIGMGMGSGMSVAGAGLGMAGGGLGNLAGQGAGVHRWGSQMGAGQGSAQGGSHGNMMMYNPYMMMGQGGYPGMQGQGQGAYNPMMGMMGGQNPMMSQAGASGASGVPGMQGGPGLQGGPAMQGMDGGGDGGMKLFDSTQMKRGRNGHYGYLEGRELAGPPVGYLPAGMQHPTSSQGQPSQAGTATPSRPATTAPMSAYSPTSATPYPASTQGYPAPSTSRTPPGAAGSNVASSQRGWGDQGAAPQARYDGMSTAKKLIQADLDTPYPRTAGGGAASAWSRYGADNEVINGIDGRMGMNRRMREGRV